MYINFRTVHTYQHYSCLQEIIYILIHNHYKTSQNRVFLLKAALVPFECLIRPVKEEDAIQTNVFA